MISYVQNMVKLFQHSRQFYYITTDPQGNYAYANHYFREKFSHLADDFIGVSFLATLCPDDIEKYQDAISLCMAEPGKPVTVELRQPSARAGYAWTMWEVSTLPSSDGIIKGIQYIGVDISKKKEHQESLELTERRYQFIFDEEPLPTWIYDIETLKFLEVNKAAISLYGYSEDEFKKMSILDIRPQDCRAEMLELLKSMDSMHTRLHKYFRHMKKNGEEMNVDVHSFGLVFEGKRARFVTAIDVTEKVKQQKALEEVTSKLTNANDELKSILENISEAIFKLDPESNLIYTSPEFTRLTGYEAAAVMGKRWFDFIHPEDLDTCYDAFGRVFEGKEVMHNIRYRFRHANGNYRWFSTSATFVLNSEKQLLYGIGISQDVTERKYAEEALEASEERYKAFISQSTEAIWRYELEEPIAVSEPVEVIVDHIRKYGFIAECNDIMARMHGFEHSAQMIGIRADEFGDLDEKRNMNALAAFIRNNFNLADAESVGVDEQGNTRYFLNNLFGIVENGFLKRAWGTRREITEKKRAEETLRFQANILENVSDIIVTTDLNHRITSWNMAAETVYGISAADAIGRQFTSIVKFDYLQASDREVELSYRNNGIWKGEVSFVDQKGQTKYLLITASSVYNQTGTQTGFINVARDVSDRKFAEQQLQASELFYKNLIGDSLDGILLTNEEGRIKFVAYSISKILGFEIEELIGKSIFELVHPDELPLCIDSFKNELANEPKVKFIVIRLPKKEGGWLWCMVRGHNLLNNPYVRSMVIYFHDDSLRKQAEDELKKTALQLRTAQHIAGMAYMEVSSVNDSLYFSDEMYRVLGIPANAMPNDIHGLLALVHPADRTKIKSDLKRAIDDGGTIQHEFRVSLPGIEKIIQAIGYLDAEHDPPTLKITVQDVTTIRSAQLALLNSESKFRSLFESSIDGIILTQVGGTVRSANPAICQMLGYSQDEIIEKKRWDIFDFTDPDSPDKRSHEDGSFKGELFLLHKDGHRIPCEVSSVLFTDSQGRSYHSTIVRDITKQKESEEELKKREMILSSTNQKLEAAVNDLSKIMDYSMDVICSLNERGEFIQVSAASEKVWGYKPIEVTGKKFTDFVMNSSEDDALNDLVSGGESVSSNFENQFRCKDGTPVFLEWSAYWYEKERIAFCVARDITLQKEIEKQLVASETRFRAFMNNSPAFSWIADEDGKLMYLNKASIQTLRVTPNDIGRKIFDLFPPTVAASFHQNNLSVLMMNKPAEAIETVPFKNGTIGTILVYLFPIHFEENAGKRLVGCVAIDITAKTKAEEALRDSERNLKAIFSSTKDAFFLLDRGLNVVAFNREAEEWFRTYAKGHEVNEVPDPISFLPDDRQLLVRNNMEKVLRGAGIDYEVEYSIDGDKAWFNAVMQPVVSATGEIDGVCVSVSNVTSKKVADKQIKETAEQLTNIMETISDGMFILNDDLTVKYMNRSAEELLQVDRSSFVGKHKDQVLSLLGATGESPETSFAYIDKAIQKRKAISFTEYHGTLHSWFEGVIYPIGGGVTIYFRDVTERKRQDMILRLEKEVLEINAIPESTLENTAQYFLKGLEKIQPNARYSVQLLSDDKLHMKPLAAPSMPKEFTKGISNVTIGPNKGSCGTSMYSKRPVYVSDTEKDPLWKDYKNVANKFNFRSCWSIPIINPQNEVLGSFATYFSKPKEPSPAEINMLERAANILRVIIENKSAEEQIRMSNQRYHFVTKATNEAIWDLDLVTNNIYWAEGYHTLFGYDPTKVYGSLAESRSRIHPTDVERIIKSLKSFLRKKTRTKWEDEYRYLKADGSYAHVLDKAYLIHDNKGNPIRLIGSMQDITSRRELEQKLLEQEIGKQRLLTQATIDGQERERKEIGKELHDNINQILSTTKLYLDLAENTASGQTAEMIGMGSKNIMEAINEIRKLSRSLVPPTLGDLGLIESVKDLCENFSNTRTFEVKFEHRNIRENQLADNQKLMLFRIIQEQTNNIVKHAKAKNVIISLRASKGAINLEITDDGQGFNLKKTKKSVGLTNIINRAELFNGKVDIITAPKKGCTIKVSIPLATKI